MLNKASGHFTLWFIVFTQERVTQERVTQNTFTYSKSTIEILNSIHQNNFFIVFIVNFGRI